MIIKKIEKEENKKRVKIFSKEYPRGISLKLTKFNNLEEIKSFLKGKIQSRLDVQRRLKNLPKLKKQLKELIGKEL